jgi:hypothetical protein
MTAISDFFTLPMILGFIAAALFLLGLACLINIARGKDARSIAA